MKLLNTIRLKDGREVVFEWHDADSFDDLPWLECSQIYSISVRRDNKVGLVTYDDAPHNLAGGSIEHELDRNPEAALKRELIEELNVDVINWLPIGYQIVQMQDKLDHIQLRVVARVEQKGEFEQDPGGSVTGNAWVNLAKVNSLINYGNIGARMIERAVEKLPLL